MFILSEISIIFGLSIVVLFVCYKSGLPAIIGFLLTGVLAGPSGLKLISDPHHVEVLAEIGVILLLFTIGIEFSLSKLMKIKRAVFFGGLFQVAASVLVVFVMARLVGQGSGQAVFLGFLIALSSTAIVMKLYQERNEVDSPHGRLALAILIFQDIAIVLMMLVTPMLSGQAVKVWQALGMLALKAAVILLIVFAGVRWIVPTVFYHIARTRSRELFLISVVGLCMAVALATYSADLSLALGAFLAGLVISESEYSHQAMSSMLPFRDVFTSFFFVSVGMLLDIRFVIERWDVLLASTGGFLLLKTLIVMAVVLSLGYPLRTAILTGMGISQIGEFSFVLSKVGLSYNLLDVSLYQFFLAVSVMTMLVTPFMIAAAHPAANVLAQLSLSANLAGGPQGRREKHADGHAPPPEDHLIIIGFGVIGRHLAMAAKMGRIPYTIIEMNPETVKKEKDKGEPIHYGDATSETILELVNIEKARIVVVAISDFLATRTVTDTIRRINPKVHIIVRTRFYQELEELYGLGADMVIPEEFETSIEIFTEVLSKYLVSREEIESFTRGIRADGYQVFRGLVQPTVSLCELNLNFPEMEIRTFRIHPDAPAGGNSMAGLRIRKDYGVTVLAIQRGEHLIPNPEAETVLQPGDHILVIGHPDRLVASAGLFLQPHKTIGATTEPIN